MSMLTFSCTWRPPCSGPAYSDQISCRGARRKSVCVCSLVHQHATQWECWTTGSRPGMSRCEMSRAYHFYFTMPIYHYRIAGMYFLAQAYNKLSCATAFISFVLYITCWEIMKTDAVETRSNPKHCETCVPFGGCWTLTLIERERE